MSNQNDMAERKQTILIVDDFMVNRALLADMLGNEYDIIEAANGVEAVVAMRDLGSRISLILLDIVMPEMDGLEVLAMMNKQGWIKEIPVIMVSSESTSSTIERAYNLGVTDFISRPFDTSIVRRRVTNTLMLYAKQAALAGMVEDEIYQREKSVGMMVSILSQIVEFRNGESGLHVLHVNTLTEMLLKHIASKTDKYGLTPDLISTIKLASSLHDIGKISIPEEVLNKPGRLTDEEFELMKTHSAIGADMLKSLPNFEEEPIIKISHEICRWHHERFDGRGYPDGLKGDEIPISAQVVALADVYDALTSKRVYKDAFPHEKAMEMILNGECGSFDPFLLECLQDIADDIQNELELSSISTNANMEINAAVAHTMKADALAPSNRTLDLLDYERMKYNFYAQMSNEIQFEYTLDPSIAIVHDYSVNKLGLHETIHNPMQDEQLLSIFGETNLVKLRESLFDTTIEDPIVQFDLQGTVDGEPRWFHLDARATWEDTKNGKSFLGAIGKLVDIHESRARLSDLERKATQDSLTGLTNHAYARKVISTRMKSNPDDTFVLMVLDMDHFKNANDEYGHLFGDEVLKHLAKTLRASVRDDDIVARVGGDEFLICMELDVDPKPLVDRIYSSISGHYGDFPISVSMGVECINGGDMEYDEFFKRADRALYSMKHNGRGGYVYGVDANFGKEEGSVISTIESDEVNSRN